MLVRLKTRGEFPKGHCTKRITRIAPLSYESYRGAVIEVEPFTGTSRGNWICDGAIFVVTDERLTRCVEGGYLGICSHYLIDDLNAYDSDYTDEQAEVGDIAFAEIGVKVTR